VGKKSFAALSAFVLVVSLLAAPFAEATDQTEERAAYKEKVEPICKTNVKANERILKGVKGKVTHGKLKPAATQFTKAANATHKALAKLKKVPQPSADKATLGNVWYPRHINEAETRLDLYCRHYRELKPIVKRGKR